MCQNRICVKFYNVLFQKFFFFWLFFVFLKSIRIDYFQICIFFQDNQSRFEFYLLLSKREFGFLVVLGNYRMWLILLLKYFKFLNIEWGMVDFFNKFIGFCIIFLLLVMGFFCLLFFLVGYRGRRILGVKVSNLRL